ncbi:hypothetical protein BSK59_02175 [Paenibacillus odorifer]|uniref:hypothetical protein n=1 Tax=Paenibacillus odorifer TaxID=189426 RepID=UPI00096F3FF2|nr:hypothetical protein [Paenibacillus odorifer]OME62299.1 hypothetical protein BSK59_02175 [Paenibacillus odorifer]
MALKADIQLDSGIVVNGSYLKIGDITGNKDNLSFQLDTYMNKNASEEGKKVLRQTLHSFTPSAEDDSLRWDKQAYEYLKTLEEFKDAEDC